MNAAAITRQSKSNLALAFVSLGRERRRDITVFYAFCRVIDDVADNAAAADGLFSLRYGWADITEHACETACEVGAVLSRRGWPGPLRKCGPDCRLPLP